MAAVGEGKMTPGAEAIVRAADSTDPRPLWVSVWGGANTLAQALWHVRATRPAAELERFVAKLRVYTISDQDDAGPWLRREFPTLHYIATPGDGSDYHDGHLDRHRGDEFYRNGAGRRLHHGVRGLGQRAHAEEGSARRVLSAALLHHRGRHAVVLQPDRTTASCRT